MPRCSSATRSRPGTYLDMTANLPVVHPDKVACAGAIGARANMTGIATVADLEEFYNQLPNGDRQFHYSSGNRAFGDACHQPAIVSGT